MIDLFLKGCEFSENIKNISWSDVNTKPYFIADKSFLSFPDDITALIRMKKLHLG